jgi:hypothetical protein
MNGANWEKQQEKGENDNTDEDEGNEAIFIFKIKT